MKKIVEMLTIGFSFKETKCLRRHMWYLKMFDSGGIHLSLLTRLQARGAKYLPGNSSQSKFYTIPHIKELYTRKKWYTS